MAAAVDKIRSQSYEEAKWLHYIANSHTVSIMSGPLHTKHSVDLKPEKWSVINENPL